MAAPLLEIRNLSVEFGTALGPLKAVDGVDLTIDTGEVAGIVGESGSGKSVAMLAVMGLLPWTARITADRLAFQGEPLLQLSSRQRRRLIGKDMAMIFQEPNRFAFTRAWTARPHAAAPWSCSTLSASRRRRTAWAPSRINFPAA